MARRPPPPTTRRRPPRPPDDKATLVVIARDVEKLKAMVLGTETSTLKGSGSILDMLGGIHQRLGKLPELIALQTAALIEAEGKTTAAVAAQTPILREIADTLKRIEGGEPNPSPEATQFSFSARTEPIP